MPVEKLIAAGSKQLKGDQPVSKYKYMVKVVSNYQDPSLVLDKYYFGTEQDAESFISTLRPTNKPFDAFQKSLTFELLEL